MVFVLQIYATGRGGPLVSNGTFPPESSIVGATRVCMCSRFVWVQECV
jgi:hypothetical protein